MPRKNFGTVKDFTSEVGNWSNIDLMEKKRWYERRQEESGSDQWPRPYRVILGECLKRGLIEGACLLCSALNKGSDN